MTRKYLGESHKKYSEACQKEVEEMKKRPLSHEQFLEQVERNRRASELQGIPVPVPAEDVALPQKEKRKTLSTMMKEVHSNPVIYSKEEIEADERLKEIIEG